MNLYEAIYKRKSCRNFDMTPLEDKQLNEIVNLIHGFKPLYENLKFPKYRINNLDRYNILWYTESVD